jgi:hypothetical protein
VTKKKSGAEPVEPVSEATTGPVAVATTRKEPVGTKGKTYKLPNAFALALGSGRGELVCLALREVQDGSLVMDTDTQCELIRLLGDLISDASSAGAMIHNVRDAADELEGAREDLRAAFVRLHGISEVLEEVIEEKRRERE